MEASSIMTKRIANLQAAHSLRRWMLAQDQIDSDRRRRIDEHITQIENELRLLAVPETRRPEFTA